MTYTVKNGTWCKDNEKEYYSTTETGLKAALKAGEITSGTRVVVHNPKYHAGQLIQSLNPECPEGCFVPHGQSFDTTVYTELAKVFPDGKLPDLRECVMVCAGQNEHITTHEHDVFNAGEFKDDCAAAGGHTHTITINDPGHGHTVTDPGHGHTVTDPGHGHTVTDPGHDHGRGTQNITGHLINDRNSDNIGGAFTSGELAGGQSASGQGQGKIVNFNAELTWSGRSENVGTGVSISSSTTGVSIGSNTTGITAECSSAGASGANVTRTKQFGVYYYIAF